MESVLKYMERQKCIKNCYQLINYHIFKCYQRTPTDQELHNILSQIIERFERVSNEKTMNEKMENLKFLEKIEGKTFSYEEIGYICDFLNYCYFGEKPLDFIDYRKIYDEKLHEIS
jgi:hypothetical protein